MEWKFLFYSASWTLSKIQKCDCRWNRIVEVMVVDEIVFYFLMIVDEMIVDEKVYYPLVVEETVGDEMVVDEMVVDEILFD